MDIHSTTVDPFVLAKNLKQARESRSRSSKDCAALIGVSSARYQNYESGKLTPSLQELEALSYFFQIPLASLLSEDGDFGTPLDQKSMQQYLLIRQKMIAAQLRLKREELELTDNEVAKKSSVNISRLRKFEIGELTLSFSELEKLTETLGITINDIFDKTSKIGVWQETQNQLKAFFSLQPDTRTLLNQTDIKDKLNLVRKLEKLPKDELDEIRDALKRLIKLA